MSSYLPPSQDSFPATFPATLQSVFTERDSLQALVGRYASQHSTALQTEALKASASSVIPFHKPALIGQEVTHLLQSLVSGNVAGDGPFSQKCHQFLEEALGTPKALLTTSCTDALEMAALLLDIQPGDQVIVPDFTFVSTVNAFVLRGAEPVFVDIRPDTLNLDERLLEAAITPRTKAIIPVHYAGVSCEMDEIMRIANRYGIPVVEDNAHGLFGRYRDQSLGTIGALGTQSFHQTKNFSCGEGGALLINDPNLIERAEVLREKGTNRRRFLMGQVDKYSWVDVGSSFLPADLLAAVLYGQLESHTYIQSRRQFIWQYYAQQLAGWATAQGVQLPTVPAHTAQAYHLFYLILPSLEARQALIQHLKAQGIHTAFHYLPLHLSEMGQQWGGRPGDFPVTEFVSERLLRLPLYPNLSAADLNKIVTAIHHFTVRDLTVRDLSTARKVQQCA
jgi:dTDP-4-amino-4,6-dideoxygalactose transaminase